MVFFIFVNVGLVIFKWFVGFVMFVILLGLVWVLFDIVMGLLVDFILVYLLMVGLVGYFIVWYFVFKYCWVGSLLFILEYEIIYLIFVLFMFYFVMGFKIIWN